MSRLLYYYVKIFGSNFDAEGFGHEVKWPGATTSRMTKARPSSPVNAIALGNVGEWKTPKMYFSREDIQDDNPFCRYQYEEQAILALVKKALRVNEVLPRYRTESTETWVTLIYAVAEDEHPGGVYFSKDLIAGVHELGASISTDSVLDSAGGDDVQPTKAAPSARCPSSNE